VRYKLLFTKISNFHSGSVIKRGTTYMYNSSYGTCAQRIYIQLVLVKHAGGSDFTLVNDMEPYKTIPPQRVASRRIASRNIRVASLHRSHVRLIKKMKLVLYVPFFSFHLTSHLTSLWYRAINNVCRNFARRAARSKGYATPDGHVSANRTGIHKDEQDLNRWAL